MTEHTAHEQQSPRKIRILVAKPGLDGHDRGAKVVARALATGFRRTVPIVGGLILGDIIYISAAIGGLAALAAAFGEVFMIVRWLGAAYLLYLAVRLWRSRPDHAEAPGRRPGGSAFQVFLAGLSITLGNPKVMVFYLALLPALIDLRTVGMAEYFAMIGIVAVVLTAFVRTAFPRRAQTAEPAAVAAA